jgi:hypothetical protein
MNERDDELLKRYRELPREAPPASIDASILAASRRATRRPAARWAAPFSVAAVLVLALGLVLKVQREAPEATLPSPARERAMPGTNAPAAVAPAEQKDEHAPAVIEEQPAAEAPKARQTPALKLSKAEKAAPVRPPSSPPSMADAAPAERRAAPADALARSNAAPAASRAQASAGAAAAPQAAAKQAATPEQRELERIARLRDEGKDDEADAALAAFRRAHPDYRIEPAMWEKVRRR